MSTDRHTLGRRLSAREVLEHPLVGLERRRTLVAIGYLAVLVGLFAVSYAGTTVTVGGRALETLTPRFDTVSAILIAHATATVTIAPVLYAVWNGGPAVSFGAPLVPILLGDLAAGQYVLGVDTAIALTVAAAAAALAVVATDVRRTGSVRPWRGADDDATLPFATMATAVAAVGVARFVAAAPPRSLEWYAPFAVCWLVPFGVLGAYWVSVVRSSVATRLRGEHERPGP